MHRWRRAKARHFTFQRRVLVLPASVFATTLTAPSAAQCEDWATFGGGFNLSVTDLVAYNSTVIAAGDFNGGGEKFPDWIAQWNESAKQWQALGSGVNDSVNALAV